MNKIKAVIIDDSPQARKLLSLMLADYRNDIEVVAEAENAIQGLECIKKEKAQIVFLDIEMPGKSGIQLAEQLLSEKIRYLKNFLNQKKKILKKFGKVLLLMKDRLNI